MTSPLRRFSFDRSSGESNSTCCEPSKLVWPIFNNVFLGSLTSFFNPSVSVAIQFLSSILRIDPTSTSATITLLLPLIARVSGTCAYTT